MNRCYQCHGRIGEREQLTLTTQKGIEYTFCCQACYKEWAKEERNANKTKN